MKKTRLMPLFAAALISGCNSAEIDFRQTESANGLIYKLHDKDPFTGKVNNIPSSMLEPNIRGICESEVKNGVLDGQTFCHTEHGKKIASISFTNGKKHGEDKRWHIESEKMVQEFNWISGLKEGAQRLYNPNTGSLVYEATMNQGRLDGSEKQWSADGKILIKDLLWANDKKTGFDNTNDTHFKYKNGKFHGVITHYAVHQDKTVLAYEDEYKDGLKDGTHKRYNSDGKLIKEEKYKNDIIISSLEQEWDQDTIIKRSFQLSTGEHPRNMYEDTPMVYDGLQIYCTQHDTHCYEINWSMGKPLNGTFKFTPIDQSHASPFSYRGVPSPDGLHLVKEGIERFHDGREWIEVTWKNGSPILINGKPGIYQLSDGGFGDVNFDPNLRAEFLSHNGSYTEH
jgi:antitoxin component YwqK of YwqJK toxin-antitoxin module